MTRRWALPLFLLVTATTSLTSPSGAESSGPLVGTWHVVLQLRDADAADPQAWDWEDRIWVIRREGPDLVWTEHRIVLFEHVEGRFVDLGTNRARRVHGRWEPDETQRQEIAEGLAVDARGTFSDRLAGSDETGWRSRAPDDLTTERAFHRERSISLRDDLATFEVHERIDSLHGTEEVGVTTFTTDTRRVEGGAFAGRYQRDGRLEGRFRAVPTRLRVDLAARVALPEVQTLEMKPGGRVASGLRLLASLFRPRHYGGARTLEIETSPTGALVELAYLHRGTQQLYRKGRAPIRVELPSRMETGDDDYLKIRSFSPGHERAEATVAVGRAEERITLVMAPLENELESVAHMHLSGRSTLTLRTLASPTLSLSTGSAERTLALARSSLGPAAADRFPSIHGPQLRAVEALQVADDLVLRLDLATDANGDPLEVRTFSDYDAARALHRTIVEFRIAHDAGPRVDRIREAIARLDASDWTGCAARFDDALRIEVGPAELSRALSSPDPFLDPTIRALLRSMGTRSANGLVALEDGTHLAPAAPLELELALGQSHQVRGLLAALRALVGELEPPGRRDETLCGLLMPDLPTKTSQAVLRRALDAEAACLATERATPEARPPRRANSMDGEPPMGFRLSESSELRQDGP